MAGRGCGEGACPCTDLVQVLQAQRLCQGWNCGGGTAESRLLLGNQGACELKHTGLPTLQQCAAASAASAHQP